MKSESHSDTIQQYSLICNKHFIGKLQRINFRTTFLYVGYREISIVMIFSSFVSTNHFPLIKPIRRKTHLMLALINSGASHSDFKNNTEAEERVELYDRLGNKLRRRFCAVGCRGVVLLKR